QASAWLLALIGAAPAFTCSVAARLTAAGFLRANQRGTARLTRAEFTAWAEKQVVQALGAGSTAVERMSGSPHFWVVSEPPASKADIDPTAANTEEQNCRAAASLAALSARESAVTISSLRPQM